MTDWTRVIDLYKTAASRTNTPYEVYGREMLKLIKHLEHNLPLEGLSVGSAMYALKLDLNQRSIQIEYTGEGKYQIYPSGAYDTRTETTLDEIVPVINRHLATP